MIQSPYVLTEQEYAMKAVTISSKYQVVIPREIREQFNLKPGQKVVFISGKHSIRLEIIRPIKESRGSLKDFDTRIERDEEDRV